MKSPKVVRCQYNGKPGWAARGLPAVNGKPLRIERRTKQEVLEAVARITPDLEKFGAAGFIPDDDRADCIRALDLKAKLGCPSLTTAVEFWATYAKRLKPRSLMEAMDELVASMEDKNYREVSIGNTLQTLEDFMGKYGGDTPCSGISMEQIRDWVETHDWSQVSKLTNYTRLKRFFTFCLKQRYVMESPFEHWEPIKVDIGERRILTLDGCRKLLATALATDRPLVPYVALQLFGGLRQEEAMARITRSHVANGEINLEAKEVKTGRRRIIPINPTLALWLEVEPLMEGPAMDAPRMKNRWSALRCAVGVPVNALRHTAATCLLYHVGGQKAALILGHSEAMLHKHYKGRVRALREDDKGTLADVENFWAITPQSLA